MDAWSAVPALHVQLVAVPENPMRHDARKHITEPVADGNLDLEDRKMDEPALLADDRLHFSPRPLLRGPVTGDQDLVHQLVYPRFLRRGGLLLSEKPHVCFA